VASEQSSLAKLCPICGRTSIKVFERPGGLHLYRCECGYSFLFDTARELVVDEIRNSKVSRGWVM